MATVTKRNRSIAMTSAKKITVIKMNWMRVNDESIAEVWKCGNKHTKKGNKIHLRCQLESRGRERESEKVKRTSLCKYFDDDDGKIVSGKWTSDAHRKTTSDASRYIYIYYKPKHSLISVRYAHKRWMGNRCFAFNIGNFILTSCIAWIHIGISIECNTFFSDI